MPTTQLTTVTDASRRRVAARSRPTPATRLHAGAAHRRASADRRRRRRSSSSNEVLPVARPARAEGLGARARAGAARRRARACSASTCPRRTAASASTRSSSLVVSEQMARSASFGATFGAQANLTHPAAGAVRHRGAEAEVPAAAASTGEIDRRLRLSESGSGSDALGAQDARDAAGRTAASC